MKAQEAAIVAGSMRINGGMLAAVARPRMTGNKTVAVAVLEVTSVKKVMNNTTARIRRNSGQP